MMSEVLNYGLELGHAYLELPEGGRVPLERLRAEDRSLRLKRMGEATPSPSYRLAYERRKRDLALDPSVTLYLAEARTRVATGLGGESPIEVGFTLPPPHGVPVLSGSSLKGAMLREAIRRLGLDELARRKTRVRDEDVDAWAPDKPLGTLLKDLGLCPREVKLPKDLALRSISELETLLPVVDPSLLRRVVFVQRLFGSVEGEGAFVPLHAWPVPERGSKFLMLDIVNPHHPDYYKGSQQLPLPSDIPKPISCLSIRPRTKYLFGLKSKGMTEELKGLLQASLQRGVGAKTGKGYGVFGTLTRAG